MLFPETYPAALGLMILTMICWGSWANTLKLCPGYRFQLFYWDYVLGMAAGAIFWGLTAGSMGSVGTPFLADVTQTAAAPILYAMAGGAIFNVANLLLVAAIDVAGLAVAFPVGIGLALVIGAISNYVLKPVGNPRLLFGGVALVVVAIVFDAAAYRKREATAKATTARGIVISLACGVLMGCFYPFVARALQGEPGHGCSGALCGDAVLYDRRADFRSARELAADEETAGRKSAGGWRRLLARTCGLASGGRAGRSDLVHGRTGEFSCFGRASGGAGGFL